MNKQKELFYKLLVPSDLEYIPPLRQFISGIARMEGFNNKACFRTEIIVDELCANAIIHGNRGKPGLIQIEALFDADKMDLSIKDSGGSKTNVENLKRAIYTSKPPDCLHRGKGMDIVHMLSDELNIKLDENGNTQVHIIKNRKPESTKGAKVGAKK